MEEASTLHEIRIESKGENLHEAYIDGQALKGVQSISVQYGVDKLPVVNIELVAVKVKVGKALADVNITTKTIEGYVSDRYDLIKK